MFIPHNPRPIHILLCVILTVPTGALTQSRSVLGSTILLGSFVF